MSKAAPQKKRLAYKPMYLAVIKKIVAYKEAKAAVKAQKKVLEKYREAMDCHMQDLYESIAEFEETKSKTQKEPVFPAESFKTPEGQETGRGAEALADDAEQQEEDDAEDAGRHVSRKLIAEMDAAAEAVETSRKLIAEMDQ